MRLCSLGLNASLLESVFYFLTASLSVKSRLCLLCDPSKIKEDFESFRHIKKCQIQARQNQATALHAGTPQDQPVV